MDKNKKTFSFKNIFKGKEDKLFFRDLLLSIIAKGGAMLVGLMTTPVLSKYFGDDNLFGSWLVVFSIINMVMNFDLGLGHGLKNQVIDSAEKNKHYETKQIISTTYFLSLIIASLVLGIGIIIVFTGNLSKILGIDPVLINTYNVKYVVLIIFITIFFDLILKNVLSLIQSKQKTAYVTIIGLITNALVIGFTFLYRGDNKFIVLALIYLLSMILPLITANLIVFNTIFKGFSPKYKHINKRTINSVLKLSIGFFVIQLGSVFSWIINPTLISRFFSAESVAIYEKATKIFLFITSTFGVVVQPPIWVAIARAKTSNDYYRFRKLKKVVMFASLAFLLGVAVLCLIYQPVLNLWLGSDTIVIPKTSILILFIYMTVYFLTAPYVIIANGLSILKPQIIISIASVALKIPLTYLLVHVFPGLSWEITIIANTILLLPQLLLPLFIKKKLKEFKYEKS